MAIYLSESTVLPVQTQQQTVSITKKISNYIFRFEDKIGQGNFSKVYKGFHQLTNEQVAIKIIELSSVKSAKLQELLFSEIQVIQSLNHPNILKCHEVLKSENNCYIITELCDGGDLQSVLKKQKCLNQSSAAPYIRDIYKGLLYLGERGIVHRDLKIANIFIHNGMCKIADFGFAKYTNNQNFFDLDIGSPLYMSPEGMIEHMYGMKTDVWAFGIIIFELLHGKTPFSYCSSEYELKRAVVTSISYHTLRADLSPEIKQLILKCLVVDHLHRPDAIALKSDPVLFSLLRPIINQAPQMYKNDFQLTNSIHSNMPVKNQLNHTEHYGKMQSIANHSISQSFHLPVQNYNNELVASPNYMKAQTQRPTSGQYIQSPSQPQIQVPLEFNINSPARVTNNFNNSSRQAQIKDSKKKQQLSQNGKSSNMLDYSQNRATYQRSFDNIQVNSYRELIPQINYPKNDNFLVPDDKRERKRQIADGSEDKVSTSSWTYQNFGNKKFQKTLSHENISKFQNNLGMVTSQHKPKQNINTSINTRVQSSFQPSGFHQTPQKVHNSNYQHEGSKSMNQSFSGKPQIVATQKLQFKQDNIKQPKKFGELIKGQKRTDANIKSIIKVDKVLESDQSLLQRNKAKSSIKFDQVSTGNMAQQVSKTRSARHSISDLSSCNHSEYMNQSVNQPNTRMPTFIQEKQKQKQEIKRNLICTIMEFKEAVGFLHYCRLYYRFVAMMKKTVHFPEIKKYDFLAKCFNKYEQHVEVYWRYLITALSELIQNIRCKEIIYDGENYKKKKMKEDKLREVTEEYLKKYTEEVNRSRTPHNKIVPIYMKSTSMSFMKERNEQFWQVLDREFTNAVQLSLKTTEMGENFIKNFRNLCYFGLRISEANAIVGNCIQMKNYKLLGDAMLENWLAQEYYGEQIYLKLKNDHYRKLIDNNALKNSETNDTETENHSRAKYL